MKTSYWLGVLFCGLLMAVIALWFGIIWGDNPVTDEKLSNSIGVLVLMTIVTGIIGTHFHERGE